MKNGRISVRKYLNEETGATSIEYAILAAGIAVAIIATVFVTGGTLIEVYSGVGAKVTAARG